MSKYIIEYHYRKCKQKNRSELIFERFFYWGALCKQRLRFKIA